MRRVKRLGLANQRLFAERSLVEGQNSLAESGPLGNFQPPNIVCSEYPCEDPLMRYDLLNYQREDEQIVVLSGGGMAESVLDVCIRSGSNAYWLI